MIIEIENTVTGEITEQPYSLAVGLAMHAYFNENYTDMVRYINSYRRFNVGCRVIISYLGVRDLYIFEKTVEGIGVTHIE